MFIVARDLARQQGIAEAGYRLIVNCNAHGGQEVYHLHVHLLGGKPLGPMVARA
jgi:histidine triad (HIT) family protein